MIDTPAIVQTEPLPYAFIHLEVPRAEMHAVLPPTLTELFAAVKAQGLPIVPWFAHHLTLDEGDFEACIPVAAIFVPTGRVQPGLWPAETVAHTVYQGDYPGLPAAWGEFSQWLRAHGHPYAGHIYEHHIVNRSTTKDPTEFRTELSWPLTSSNIRSGNSLKSNRKISSS